MEPPTAPLAEGLLAQAAPATASSPPRRRWCGALLALGAGGALWLGPRPRGEPPAAAAGATLLAEQHRLDFSDGDLSLCGSRDSNASADAIPWLVVAGGPPKLPRERHWIARVCTKAYPGPNCTTAAVWSGHVALCLEGQRYDNVTMHIRGHTSRMFPKLQYTLRFEHPTSMLGMQAAKTWVLGTSWVDTSFQRNPLAFDLYRGLGGWASESRYVNFRMGDRDWGLMYVGEPSNRASDRLGLHAARRDKQQPSGYFLTIDWPKSNRPSFRTSTTGTVFNVEYPQDGGASGDMAKLVRVLEALDAAAAAPAPADGEPLEEALDFESFARGFALEELAKDADGYMFSMNVAVIQGKLYHTAPWDFDLAFGFFCNPEVWLMSPRSENRSAEWTEAWNVEIVRDSTPWVDDDGFPDRKHQSFGTNKRAFFLNLWRRPQFRARFASTWKAARGPGGPLADAALQQLVLERRQRLAAAAARDLAIWSRAERCGLYHCCSKQASQDFGEASDLLLRYLLGRARWIDEHA